MIFDSFYNISQRYIKNTRHLLSVRDCKGITLETDSNEWTLRASEEPKNSTVKEISRLKKCFAGIIYTNVKYSTILYLINCLISI